MTDLHTRFRTLDHLSAPNLWHEIEEKAMTTQPMPRNLPWVLIAVVLLLGLALGGAALIGSRIVKFPAVVETSPSPTSTPDKATASPTPVEVRAGRLDRHRGHDRSPHATRPPCCSMAPCWWRAETEPFSVAR